MEKNKRTLLLVLSGVLVVGLLLSAVLPLQAGAAGWFSPIQAQPASPEGALAASLSGAYVGQVELDYTLPGEYSDPLNPPDPGDEPLPNLGSIDFGLQLIQSETGIEGYVDLEHTLVFTTEHTVGATAFGPLVTGSFDGTDLVLESERISLISAGQRMMRQFQLTGSVADEDERQIVGEYRETLWGYGLQPVTVVGRFTLDWNATAATDFIFLPLINMQ